MRFLIDENLAKSCAAVLRSLGHEAVHVAEIGFTSTDDEDIAALALRENYIVVTFDLDFSRIMALSKMPFPSVITFRLGELSLIEFRELMLLHLPNLSSDLLQGALVTIDSRGVRVQKLPIAPKR